MDNIVMATLAGMPMADGTATATGAAASADGGQFGALVKAQLALLTGEGKGGQKQKTGEADDSLAALLLASLIQGLVHKDGKDDEAASDEAGAAAVQAQPTAGISPATDGANDLLQVLADNNSGNGAFMRLFTGNKDVRAALMALLQGGGAENGSGGLNQTGPADAAQQFSELLTALQGGATEGNAVGTADNAAANPGGLHALTEIRKLFSEIVSKMESGEAADGTGGAKTAQAAADAPGQLTRAAINEILERIDALMQPGNDAVAAETRPVVTISLDTADTDAGATDLEAVGADETQGVATEHKKDPVDFSSALRAYRGDASGGVHAATAPKENSAAAALRQGEQAFDTIVDKIAAMQNAGGKEMEIRLKPDFLGHVVIKLSMGDGGLTATIAASNPKVQDAFLSQVSALQNSLAEQGLKDVRVVVTSSSVQDASLQQQQLSQGHGQSGQQKQKRHTPTAIAPLAGSAVAAQPLLAYEQAYRTGLVNRLA